MAGLGSIAQDVLVQFSMLSELPAPRYGTVWQPDN